MKSKYNDIHEEKNELRIEITSLLTELAKVQNNQNLLEQNGIVINSNENNNSSTTFLTNDIIIHNEEIIVNPVITENNNHNNHFEEFIKLKQENKELKLELLKFTSKPSQGSNYNVNTVNVRSSNSMKNIPVSNDINNNCNILQSNKSNKIVSSKSKPLL